MYDFIKIIRMYKIRSKETCNFPSCPDYNKCSQGIIQNVTRDYISSSLTYVEERECYEVSEYLLDAIRHPAFTSDCIGACYKLLGIPKVSAVVPLQKVYCNTPLWTKHYEAYIIPSCDSFNFYLAFEVSPRVGSSLTHYVSREEIAVGNTLEECISKGAEEDLGVGMLQVGLQVLGW